MLAMKILLQVLLLCALAPSVFAQSANPADPKAAVPPTAYASAMQAAPAAPAAMPDKMWKQANEQVQGQSGGHAMHGAGAHAHAQHAAAAAGAHAEHGAHAQHAAPAADAHAHMDHGKGMKDCCCKAKEGKAMQCMKGGDGKSMQCMKGGDGKAMDAMKGGDGKPMQCMKDGCCKDMKKCCGGDELSGKAQQCGSHQAG